VNALTPAWCAGVLSRKLLGRLTVDVRLGVAGRLLNSCCCRLLLAILLSGLLLGPAGDRCMNGFNYLRSRTMLGCSEHTEMHIPGTSSGAAHACGKSQCSPPP
jgi:hypothetical protein